MNKTDKPADAVTLLPCPFCGGEALLENTITQASIMCCDCPAVMRREHTTRSFDDGTHRVIAAWNTRQASIAQHEVERGEIIKAVVEEAEQACRYVAKHTAPTLDAGELRDGFEMGCTVCEQAIAENVQRYDSRIPPANTNPRHTHA